MSDMTNPIVTITMENGACDDRRAIPRQGSQHGGQLHLPGPSKGFYDGLIFHPGHPRLHDPGRLPRRQRHGGPGYDIRGEFSGNGFVQNDLKHTTGVLSMARAMHPDSAGSQFFIMVEQAPHLDGQYASFGKVIEGMEVADAIVSAKRDWNDKPRDPQRMKRVTVETFGVDYPEPEKC